MHELARQHYLEAMGIQTYMPRLVLPAAPVPRQSDLSGLASPQVMPPLVADSPTQSMIGEAEALPPIQTPQSVDALLASMGAPSVAASVAKKVARPLPAAETANISFAVSLWQFSGLMVIADRHPEQALPVKLLLKNILVALGRGGDVPVSPEIIRWPLENVPAAQAGPVASYLTSLLQARRITDQPTTLLCFGRVIRAHLSTDATDRFQEVSLTLSDKGTMPLITLPSLEEILMAPDLKAPVWAAIARLRQQ